MITLFIRAKTANGQIKNVHIYSLGAVAKGHW